MPEGAGPFGALWDWRRQVAALYEAVRTTADPEVAWHAWRQGREHLFESHAQSPLEPDDRAAFGGLRFLPYDPALRFHVALRPCDGPHLTVDLGEDGLIRLRGFAQTDGLAPRLNGELTIFWVEGYGGGAFLPFADTTNGDATFGGGRYLLDTIKGADLGTATNGSTILDFNFAYNPSCSYAPRYVCPLAPAENRLTVPINAGETVPRCSGTP